MGENAIILTVGEGVGIMEEASSAEGQSLYGDEHLAAHVIAAFSEIPYPGGDRLMLDLYQGDWEADIAASAFAGRQWTTVPLKTLGFHQESLHYFTPDAFRYYLPAYLLAALKRLSDAEVDTRIVDIPWTLVYHLSLPKRKGPALDQFLTRMAGLTLEQKTVIRDVLRWLEQLGKEWERRYLPKDAQGSRKESESSIALREYWENIR